MSTRKFADMLQSGELYFARLDRMSDVFEGAPSEAAMANAMRWGAQNPVRTTNGLPIGVNLAVDPYWLNQIAAFINCWYMDDTESLDMWREYGSSVAVRSTYQRLEDSLAEAIQDVNIGQVIYRDRWNPTLVETFGNTLAPALRKQPQFVFERELRAVTLHCPNPLGVTGPDIYFAHRDMHPNHVRVKVDLNRLIEGVYVAPGRAPEFREEVASLIRPNGFDFPLRVSSLDKRPVRV